MDANKKDIPFELHPLGFIEAFTQLGVPLEALLEHTGISTAMLDRRLGKISLRQQKQLLNNGIALSQTPGVGLIIGLNMDWSFHGNVGSVINCSPDLKSAAAAWRRFLPIAQPHLAERVCQPGAYIDQQDTLIAPLLSQHCDDDSSELQQFEIEYRLARTLMLYHHCGNKTVAQPQIHVWLNYPEPAHLPLYQQLPCDRIAFNAPQSAIGCHYLVMAQPWRPLRSAAFKRVIEQCEQDLQRSHPNTTVRSKVLWHVSQAFNQPISLEQVADHLALSPRALTRKLAQERTSFRTIAHQARMELTALHLQRSSLSVDEIAQLLGFSSPSSLRRAIKNWCGQTAGSLRSQQQTLNNAPMSQLIDIVQAEESCLLTS